jgi:hypothetical protein
MWAHERRMRMKRHLGVVFVSVVIIMTFAANARAVDLKIVGSNNDELVAIDADSIKRVEGTQLELGHLEVTVHTLFNEPQKQEDVPSPFSALITVLWFRCINATGSISEMVFLADDNVQKPVAKFDVPITWKPIDPKSNVGIVWKYVCTH